MVLPRPRPTAAPAHRGVSVDSPAHQGGAGYRAEGAAVGAGARGVAQDLEGAGTSFHGTHPLDQDAFGEPGVPHGDHLAPPGPGRRSPRSAHQHQAITRQERRFHRGANHLNAMDRTAEQHSDGGEDGHRRQDPCGAEPARHRQARGDPEDPEVRRSIILGKVRLSGTIAQVCTR